MREQISLLGAACCVALFSGCATPKDYTAFRQHQPDSVLVLPPLNESVDVTASYGVLSTITRPMAEMGYYVYPVAVIDYFLKENGLPTPGEMHQIPLAKIDEIIGADAVLYMEVEEYGTTYTVFDSATTVRLDARLVDVDTGEQIWAEQASVVVSAAQQSGAGLIGGMVAAVVNQVVASASDQAHGVSAQANTQLLMQENKGFLPGPLHPEFGMDE